MSAPATDTTRPAAPDGPLSPELTELGLAFRRVFRSLSRLRGRDTHLGASELSHAQFELLIELQERGELPAGELAAAARLAPATVTQMLDHLAECGHVERVRSADRPARGRVAAHAPGRAQDRGQARRVAGPLGGRAGRRRRARAAGRHARARTAREMVEDTPPGEPCAAREQRARTRPPTRPEACLGSRNRSAIVGTASQVYAPVRAPPAKPANKMETSSR